MYQMRLITHRLPLRAPPLPYHHHRYLINTYLWHSLVQSIQFRLFFIQFNDRVNNLDYHLLIWILLKTWTKKASIRGRAVYIVIVPAAVWSLLWFIDLVFFLLIIIFVSHTPKTENGPMRMAFDNRLGRYLASSVVIDFPPPSEWPFTLMPLVLHIHPSTSIYIPLYSFDRYHQYRCQVEVLGSVFCVRLHCKQSEVLSSTPNPILTTHFQS